MKTYAIIVLSDGETYASADGSSLMVISEETLDQLENGDVRIHEVQPLCEIHLRELTQPTQ